MRRPPNDARPINGVLGSLPLQPDIDWKMARLTSKSVFQQNSQEQMG